MVYMDTNFELHDDGLKISGTGKPVEITVEQKFWKKLKEQEKVLTPEEYKKLYFKNF